MNTIKDDCKMSVAEELHDILAEVDNVTVYAAKDLPEGAVMYFGGCQLMPAPQPTPPTAKATATNTDE